MKLTYPWLKEIVNAGGSEETINIVNSFKKHDNFTIIYQKGERKIKAINDCLEQHVKGNIKKNKIIVYNLQKNNNSFSQFILYWIY